MHPRLRITLVLCAVTALGSRQLACSCDPGLAAGAACTRAQDCAGNLVCDPDTGTCAELGCTDNADCGAGAICAASGRCVDNVAGGECDSATDCLATETCRAGSCVPRGRAGEDCVSAEDCATDLVCDPASHTCAELSCSGHSECGAGSYCNSAGDCATNTAGGPCAGDLNCVQDQVCSSGRCVDGGGPGDSCTSAEDCVGDLVCSPQGDSCVQSLPCSDHGDCGQAAHCTVDGACAPSVAESPCQDDSQCATADRCLGVVCIPDGCEGEAFAAERVPANVMIAVDRSGSMGDNIGSDGSKWNVARNAVNQLLADRGADIRFGLNLFPGYNQTCSSGADCAEGTISVDIGDNTAADISSYLAGARTCRYGTPIAEDLVMLQGYAGLQDLSRGNFVLLITDGQATCDDPTPEVEALLAQTPSVRTFVVGFGSGVDPQQLTDMANAGDTARQQSPVYYQADDAASLAAALADIAGSVLGCEYSLLGAASDPDLLHVYFNGVPVPRDPTGLTGWNYVPATGRLAFAGNACVALQAGVITNLTIAYGCPIDTPDPVDAGTPGHDGGATGVDAGGGTLVDGGTPGGDAGPAGQCNDRCMHPCGQQACLLPAGQCGPCSRDGDCCGDSICLTASGVCLKVSG